MNLAPPSLPVRRRFRYAARGFEPPRAVSQMPRVERGGGGRGTPPALRCWAGAPPRLPARSFTWRRPADGPECSRQPSASGTGNSASTSSDRSRPVRGRAPPGARDSPGASAREARSQGRRARYERALTGRRAEVPGVRPASASEQTGGPTKEAPIGVDLVSEANPMLSAAGSLQTPDVNHQRNAVPTTRAAVGRQGSSEQDQAVPGHMLGTEQPHRRGLTLRRGERARRPGSIRHGDCAAATR